MNKAKALFTAGVIVVVAGASAVCWQLNEHGVFEPEKQTNGDEIVYNEDEDKDKYIIDAENEEKHETIAAETKEEPDNEENIEKEENEPLEEKDYKKLDSFLTVLSSLYFSEGKPYKSSAADEYELLRFAYLYNTVYGGGSNVTLTKDDEIGVYSGIPAEKANEICKRFFGKAINLKSVYTEKTYSFFIYENGCFYTPAADGMGYDNKAFVDSAENSGGIITVAFTVYSSGVSDNMSADEAKENGIRYGEGTAKLRIKGNNYIVEAYSLTLG